MTDHLSNGGKPDKLSGWITMLESLLRYEGDSSSNSDFVVTYHASVSVPSRMKI